jgi:hypothetical protein
MNAVRKTMTALKSLASVVAIVATAAPAAAACGAGIAAGDISNIAWMENQFPRAVPPTYVELDRTAELSRTGPFYYGLRYVYSRPKRSERANDAPALFNAAARILIDFGFFDFDPQYGRLGLDAIYRTVSAKRCGVTVQFEFFGGAEPRLEALFSQLTQLERGAAWSAAKGEVPERIPVFHVPTAPPVAADPLVDAGPDRNEVVADAPAS